MDSSSKLLLASFIAIPCFAVFAISIALVVSFVHLLISLVESFTYPKTPNSDFYNQVKYLMMDDLLPSTS